VNWKSLGKWCAALKYFELSIHAFESQPTVSDIAWLVLCREGCLADPAVCSGK
jgi:hypothetical protein